MSKALHLLAAAAAAVPLCIFMAAAPVRADDRPAAAHAAAASFDVRMERGKAAETEFAAYQSAMFAQVGNQLAYTMRACFDRTREPQTDAFVLVADITGDGKAAAIEVRPATNIASCFAAGFGRAAFPAPPRMTDGGSFPVTIEMQIK